MLQQSIKLRICRLGLALVDYWEQRTLQLTKEQLEICKNSDGKNCWVSSSYLNVLEFLQELKTWHLMLYLLTKSLDYFIQNGTHISWLSVYCRFLESYLDPPVCSSPCRTLTNYKDLYFSEFCTLVVPTSALSPRCFNKLCILQLMWDFHEY